MTVTGQRGSKNNMSHAECAWLCQLQLPCFQGCHLKTSGHMKNAGSISDVKGPRKAWGKRPKNQEADLLLNKTSFATGALDAIKNKQVRFFTHIIPTSGVDLNSVYVEGILLLSTVANSCLQQEINKDSCRGDKYYLRHQIFQDISLLKALSLQTVQRLKHLATQIFPKLQLVEHKWNPWWPTTAQGTLVQDSQVKVAFSYWATTQI